MKLLTISAKKLHDRGLHNIIGGHCKVVQKILNQVIVVIVIIVIELTENKTILEITVEIEPQPATLDFKNLSQYSSRSK